MTIDISVARLSTVNTGELEWLLHTIMTYKNWQLTIDEMTKEMPRLKTLMYKTQFIMEGGAPFAVSAAVFIIGQRDLPLTLAYELAGVPVGDDDALMEAAMARGCCGW